MSYFRTCPLYGNNLDPGERCDCEEEKERRERMLEKVIAQERETGQLMFNMARLERSVNF